MDTQRGAVADNSCGLADNSCGLADKFADTAQTWEVESQTAPTEPQTGQIEVDQYKPAEPLSKPKPHRWKPGESGNPAGRKPRSQESVEYLEAIKARITPEQAAGVVERLMFHPNSWRANEAGLRIFYDYILGKPVARLLSATAKWTDFIAALDTGNTTTIDGTVSDEG